VKNEEQGLGNMLICWEQAEMLTAHKYTALGHKYN